MKKADNIYKKSTQLAGCNDKNIRSYNMYNFPVATALKIKVKLESKVSIFSFDVGKTITQKCCTLSVIS